MTRDHLLKVLRKYDAQLADTGYGANRCPTNLPVMQAGERLIHARWMCQEAAGFLDKSLVTPEDVEKANRWLGFIQGVLWGAGVKTIDEMRDDNRSEG